MNQTTSTQQAAEPDTSAATSINGSTATNETANTDVSSTTGESTVVETVAPVKAASAPPKINPWKVRAQQLSVPSSTKTQDGAPSDTTDQPQPEAAPKPDEAVRQTKGSSEVDGAAASLNNTANGPTSSFPAQARRTHRPTKSTAPAIDDESLWPSLDKATEEAEIVSQRRQASGGGEHAEGTAPSAPKVTGKEKWTKYTPTIMYTPIPSKPTRGAFTGAKSGSRGGSTVRSGGREKPNAAEDNGDNAQENGSKSPRSSETSRPRVPKGRSLSASTTSRSDRPPRRESQHQNRDGEHDPAAIRSHSSKRSDRGSTSAPTGNTPIPEATKSQGPTPNGQHTEGASIVNGGEPRGHRASYDSSFTPRGRGGYRGTRGNYQSNFNNRYPTGVNSHHNNSYMQQQQQFQAPRGYGQRDQMPYGYDQYQNFVNPALAPVMIDPMVARQMVLNQCEYYFSIENLCKDLFLRKHMDEQGFVNLPILANFNRVKSITMDYALIRDVCVMSSVIELRAAPGAYDKIRRADGWEQWVLPSDQRDPSTKDVPEPVPEIPVTKTEDVQDDNRDMSSTIGAPAFVPGQSISEAQPSNVLNENFANLGMGRKLSPDVKEFKAGEASKTATESTTAETVDKSPEAAESA